MLRDRKFLVLFDLTEEGVFPDTEVGVMPAYLVIRRAKPMIPAVLAYLGDEEEHPVEESIGRIVLKDDDLLAGGERGVRALERDAELGIEVTAGFINRADDLVRSGEFVAGEAFICDEELFEVHFRWLTRIPTISNMVSISDDGGL